MSDTTVCVVGLGFVGLTLAVALADVGYRVHGTEVRSEVVDALQAGKVPFHEPGLDVVMGRAVRRGRLTVSTGLIDTADVYIITVGTPLGADGRCRLDMIDLAAWQVAAAMPAGALVVLRSTVKIGTTEGMVHKTLAAAGKAFDLAFCPERTLEGHALTELRGLPQIVGGMTPLAAERASAFFNRLTPTIVRVADTRTAEVIKLVSNAHRDVRFAYANEIALICDAIGISAAQVIHAGNLHYPRTDLPMPGPVGGPCLTKDSHILAEGMVSDLYAPITRAARQINETQPKHAARFLEHACRAAGIDVCRVALLGWAFKGRPPTDDTRGSMAQPINESLRAVFPAAQVRGYDPLIREGMERSAKAAMEGADVVVVMTNHVEFATQEFMLDAAASMARPGIIYDFWAMHTTPELPEGLRYVALGGHGVCDT